MTKGDGKLRSRERVNNLGGKLRGKLRSATRQLEARRSAFQRDHSKATRGKYTMPGSMRGNK